MWNPATQTLETGVKDGEPVYIRLPINMTEDEWKVFAEWIQTNHKGPVEAVKISAHAWLEANSRDSLIKKCTSECLKKQPSDSTTYYVKETLDMNTRKVDVSIPIVKKDIIGSLLGSRGVIAKRTTNITGLTINIKDDELKLTGSQALEDYVTDAYIRKTFQDYMTFTTMQYDIESIVDVSQPTGVIIRYLTKSEV
jgi:hypothetical protein